MNDDLEWIRWRLDRLSWLRMMGTLDEKLEDEYELLARRERQLMQADNRAAN